MNRFRSKAFTLLEIMVSLVIITIALGAIVENTTASTRNAQYLQDKTVASWVALNQISLIRAKREWGIASTRQGRVEMAQREWLWKMKIFKTDNAFIRRLEIDVFDAEDDKQVLSSLTGYLGSL